MRNALRALLLLSLATLALAGLGCGGSLARPDGAASDGGDPSTLACTAATDCTRTEIDHEIRTSTDCPCLFGCPFIIVNVQTANRRMAQYNALCTPHVDGHGMTCGIDDCIQPAPLACSNQMCRAASITAF